MAEELTCITCPLGCRLTAERGMDGDLTVSGNRCARGAVYAREELLAPKRVVTATCRAGPPVPGSGGRGPGAAGDLPRRIPCRSAGAFPRERVPELLAAIYALEVAYPVERGQVLLRDALGSGLDVIATRSIG